MAYQRQARTFSYANFDLTRRDVDVVQDKEEHPALIRPPSGFRTSVGGTVAMRRAEFGRPGAVRMVSR